MNVPLSKRFLTFVLTCALVSPTLHALASVPDETTTITLDQAVHFTGTDGSDVVANTGEYTVEAAQEWLRLIPGTERRDALLIEAQPGTHDVKVEIPLVISTPGTEPNETDIHVLELLNPDGTSLVATGTYSGIQSRGFVASAQASDSNDSLSVTIDRTAQFPNPEGKDVLVSAGTYAVTVGSNQFTLTEGTGTPITIETTEWSHTTEIPSPTVVFLSSEEGEIPQRHLLVLYYPDGKTLQAVGTDPIVTSRGTQELPGEYVIDPALVTFEQSVHFTAPDGTPMVVHSGTYTAEAAEQAIRLIPSGDSQEALLIEARQGTHEAQLEVLLALSLPGTTLKELDFHYLMLLLPTGHSLEATGSYSGIQTRGWFKKAFNTAKSGVTKGVNTVGNTAKQGANIVGSGVQQGAKIIEGGAKKVVSAGTAAAIQAGKGIEQGAKLTWDGTKWVVRQVETGAKIAFCYTTVGALKAGKAVTGLMDQLIPKAISNQKNMVAKLTRDLTFRNNISKKISAGVNANLNAIPELKRIQVWMKNPANKAKLDAMFSINNFCKDSLGTMEAKLKRFGLAPKFALGQPKATVQVQPQVLPQITVAMVPGTYRHNPVQNDWHIGSIVPDGAGLRWTNKAGTSWHLTPDLANQQLLAQGRDNPYAAQGLKTFKLIVRNGQITGFQFGGGTYLRVSAPQPQVRPQVLPQITMAMVPGTYRHNPVQNDWHIGSIVPDGAGLRWTNKAGASWHLTPDLANQQLLAEGRDNPYAAQGLKTFKLIVRNGQITGFQFGGGTYLRETAQTQPQTAIRSRGVDTPHFYMGYGVTFDVGKGIGVIGGLYGVTDFRGNGGKYWFLGAQVGIFVGAGGAVQAIFFPKVDLASFEGMGWGLGGSLGKGVTFAADGIFDEKFNLQGFGVGVGAGVGSKAIGDIAVSWDYSFKY